MKLCLIVLLLFVLSGCTTLIKSSNGDIEIYYIKLIQGEIGCMANDIKITNTFESSGMCGSIDTLKISCKGSNYICTMSSVLPVLGANVGVTNSGVCKTTARCAIEK